MENHSTHKSKSYDLNKLENFLSKVKSKLQEGTENVGKENEKIISNWLSDFKLNRDQNNVEEKDRISISYNENVYKEKINLHIAENSENLFNIKENISFIKMDSFYEKFYVLIEEKNSPHQKEEAFNFISKNLENFEFTQKEENFLISFLNETNWEKINGAILILSLILQKESCYFNKDNIISCLDKNFVYLIKQQEYRLRANLTNIFRHSINILIESKNYDLIKRWISDLFSDIFWNFENVNHSENKQHPTLETSKNILNEILNEIKICIEQKNLSMIHENFLDSFENPTLKLIQSLLHDNKGIRSSSYEILKNLIYFRIFKKFESFQIEILKNLSLGLIDFYPQIRYTASLFLVEFTKSYSSEFLLLNKFFKDKILPKICMNRYIPVEGVKNTSLEIWKMIVASNGINIINENFENYFIHYLSEMNSKSHLAREAACRCLQEIIMKVYEDKIHNEIVRRHREIILNSIEKCVKDPCWNVRESGLYAAGYLFNVLHRSLKGILIKESKNNTEDPHDDDYLVVKKFSNFSQLIKSHLFDNIYEARSASAYAIRIILSLNDKTELENFNSDSNENLIEFIKSLITQINNSSILTCSYNNFTSELRKQIENQNKLSPNHIDKCSSNDPNENSSMTNKECSHSHNDFIPDLGFIREIDLWEYSDGIIHLLKEFSEDPNSIKKIDIKFENVLMSIIDYLCKNYATLQNLSKKTLWISLNTAFQKIHKSEIDFYFEYIQKLLLKEIQENLNNLSVFEAENLLITISKIKGKRFILNKIKNLKMDSNEFCVRIEKLLNN